MIPPVLKQQVIDRAADRCEYCRLPLWISLRDRQADHIVPEFHGGTTVLENLAACCSTCNVYKGTNLAGLDPRDRSITRLYHPRDDRWSDHFEWAGPLISGLTPVGRATIAALRMNDPNQIELRTLLLIEGLLPPETP